MRSIFVISLAALTLTACAPAQQSASPTGSAVTGMSQTIVLKTSDADRHEDVIVDEPPVQTLIALKDAYAALGIEMKYSNPSASELGNLNFTKMHSIAWKPMSSYLNCGQTPYGLAADAYRIQMSMVSMVVREGAGGSRIQTRLQAKASDPGVSTEPRECQSLGTLEAKLHQLVKTKLAM
jgi:ribosomal protein L11